MVFWITGLSGAGKTTIGKELYHRLKALNPAVVFLDGDAMREVLGDVFGYAKEDRLRCAEYYGRLCRLLAQQGMTVVCCTISMFHSVRSWNREHIPGYVEVYLQVPLEVLHQRDQKKMYSGVVAGDFKRVVGLDEAWEEPQNPDIVIQNSGDVPAAVAVDSIIEFMQTEGK